MTNKLDLYIKKLKERYPSFSEAEILSTISKNQNLSFQQLILLFEWKYNSAKEIYFEQKFTKTNNKIFDKIIDSIFSYSKDQKHKLQLKQFDKEKYIQEYIINKLNIIHEDKYTEKSGLFLQFTITKTSYILLYFIDEENSDKKEELKIDFEKWILMTLEKINWKKIVLSKDEFLYFYKDVFLIFNAIWVAKNQEKIKEKLKNEFNMTYTINYWF